MTSTSNVHEVSGNPVKIFFVSLAINKRRHFLLQISFFYVSLCVRGFYSLIAPAPADLPDWYHGSRKADVSSTFPFQMYGLCSRAATDQ